MQQLAGQIKDPREVLDLSLALLTKNQDKFIKKLSNQIGYPLFTDQSDLSLDLIHQLPINKLEKLGAIAINRAPRLMDVGIGKGWAGLYEVTPDHNAILGEFKKISRFFYATGFSGHGFLQGPAIGEILRDLYLNKQPFVNIDKLSAERFSGSGQLRPEYNIV